MYCHRKGLERNKLGTRESIGVFSHAIFEIPIKYQTRYTNQPFVYMTPKLRGVFQPKDTNGKIKTLEKIPEFIGLDEFP